MMKERILQIMKRENMTQQDFAKAIEVSPASLSNIFNGKTNPTNNHVSAIHRRFPDINVNWLMFGEGDMYSTHSGLVGLSTGGSIDEETDATGSERTLFSDGDFHEPVEGNLLSSQSPSKVKLSENAPQPMVREVVKYVDKPARKITEIRIFFDDGTFEVYS